MEKDHMVSVAKRQAEKIKLGLSVEAIKKTLTTYGWTDEQADYICKMAMKIAGKEK